MRLSIITPTLNPGPQLARTIQSVLDQNFDDLEHLIVDGGSTDGTLELIHGYEHLRLVSDGDEGIFDAMNIGIAASTGTWIYFMGSDDRFADEKVLRDLAPYFESELDVIYGDIFDEHMQHVYDGPFDQLKIRDRNICHQAIFFRRSVFERVGLFDESYDSFADWDHNLRWMLDNSIRKQYVDRTIAVYGGHGHSFHNPDAKFKRDRLYRYLTYGREVLTPGRFWSTWVRDVAASVATLDLKRMRRAFSLAIGA